MSDNFLDDPEGELPPEMMITESTGDDLDFRDPPQGSGR